MPFWLNQKTRDCFESKNAKNALVLCKKPRNTKNKTRINPTTLILTMACKIGILATLTLGVTPDLMSLQPPQSFICMKNLLSSLLLITAVAFTSMSHLNAQDAAKHPTKDEVVKFVEEGAAFAKEKGKDAFLKEIMKADGQFKRGELYFYAYDFNCVCVSHGTKPELVGKDLSNLMDVKGNKMIQALRDEAKKGSGWVAFFWQNPTTNRMEKKLGYVMKLDDTTWFGSGTYAPDAE